MKKTFLAITLAVLFTLALAAPAFAQYMEYSGDFVMNGTISGKMQAGHLCNTGAEMKQTISGAGSMTKSTDIYMVEGKLDVDDQNQFIAAATSSLTVTTAIELCAPAKHVFAADMEDVIDALWDLYEDEEFDEADFAEWLAQYGLTLGDISGLEDYYEDFKKGDVVPVQDGYLWGWLTEIFGVEVTKPLTKQIWAAQVSADAGYSGQLDTAFTAAYGPINDPLLVDEGDLDDGLLDDDTWAFEVEFHENGFDVLGTVTGEDYVGNYFHVTQFARTSMGTTKRFIDISSPWSHAYLSEDMTIVGMAEVSETFMMDNIKEGEAATTDWWDLF